MTARVIAHFRINEAEPEALATYLRGIEALMQEADARIIARFDIVAPLGRARTTESVAVLEYPDQDAAWRLLNSEAYRDLLPLKKRAFLVCNIAVVGNVVSRVSAAE